jgi:hypothetical protein
MTEELIPKAQHAIEKLEAGGHHEQAQRLKGALETNEGGLLYVLREACQTLLTAVESLDPYTNTLIEELRQEVDKRLVPHGTAESPKG